MNNYIYTHTYIVHKYKFIPSNQSEVRSYVTNQTKSGNYINIPSRPVEDFNMEGVTFLVPSKTAEYREQARAIRVS